MKFKGYSLEQLADIAKKQIRNKKYLGYFQTFNVGNMETNINIFNRASGTPNLGGENISSNPSGMIGGEGDISIGNGPMGESLNEAIEDVDLSILKASKPNYQIKEYTSINGKNYCQEFLKDLEKLNKSLFKKLKMVIKLLATKGPALRLPHSKVLTNGLNELRAQAGNNIARLFYCFDGNKIVLLFNGFIKKTNNTPDRELELALKLMEEYFGGKNDN